MAQSRTSSKSGVATGPVVFVMTLLGILATAINAGLSAFGVGGERENARTSATALLQIGSSLKIGADRVISQGAEASQITTTGAPTQFDMFYVNGGGLTYPSVTLAANPATDRWVYTWAPVTNMGTAAVDKIAVLKILQGACDEVNKMVNGPVTTTGFAPSPSDWLTTPSNMTNWDSGTGVGTLDGKRSGCFQATTNSPGYYFYEVLIPQ